MKRLFSLLFVMFVLVTGYLRAQTSNFVFFPHILSGARTNIPQGTIVPDSISLKNNGPNTFLGTIKLQTSVDTLMNGGHIYVPLSLDTVQAASFPANASQYFQLSQTYSTKPQGGKCKTGNNVIVIWPVFSTGGFSMDTIRDTVYINAGFAGISKLDVNSLFNIYPNPAQNVLTIRNESATGERLVQEIRILDLQGKQIALFLKRDIIDVGNLPKGFYLVEVLFNNGTVGRRKLLLE